VDFSIIIPSYNDGPLLARCLGSLCHLQTPRTWEVVVALDGSCDGSLEMVRRGLGDTEAHGLLDHAVAPDQWRDLPLVLVDLQVNKGRSAARNAALRVARGKWLLFLDADLRVGPRWAEDLLRLATEPEQVVVGEMVYEAAPDGPLDAALLEAEPAAERRRLAALRPHQRYLETRGPWKYRHGGPMPARYFYTCNSAVHSTLMDAAGLFDEELRGWGGEDTDMGLRLEAAGARMVYCREARALHAQERSFTAHCANLARMGREALPRLVERHPLLLDAMQLPRLLPRRLGGQAQWFLVAAHGLGLGRALVLLDAMGLPLGERLYNLAVFLHYAGAYRQARLDTGATPSHDNNPAQ